MKTTFKAWAVKLPDGTYQLNDDGQVALFYSERAAVWLGDMQTGDTLVEVTVTVEETK